MDPTPAEAAALLKQGKKKAKGKTVSLNDFLGGEDSWGEQLANTPLPAGPAVVDEPAPVLPRGPARSEDVRDVRPQSSFDRRDRYDNERRDRYGDERRDRYGDERRDRYGDERRDRNGDEGHWEQRSARPPRPQNPLPTEPPFTAYLGNLPYSVSQDDITAFFSGLQIKEVRMVKDAQGRPKGYGYIEFATVDDLSNALKKQGQMLGGRNANVDVAESKPVREDRTAGSWHSADRPAPRSDRGFHDRDDRQGGFRDRDRGDREERRYEPSRSDLADNWRRQDPLPPSTDRRDRDRDGEHDRRGRGGFNRDREPRHFESRDREESRSGAPAERPKLNLKPRSVDSAASTPTETAAPKPNKPNPFGDAKPRDENEILKQIEERKKQRQNQSADSSAATSPTPDTPKSEGSKTEAKN